MSLAALEKPSLLAARMTDIERDIRRKMDALAKHVEHTELLDESSIQEAGKYNRIYVCPSNINKYLKAYVICYIGKLLLEKRRDLYIQYACTGHNSCLFKFRSTENKP